MDHRMLLVVATLTLSLSLAAACGSKEPPKKAEPAPATAAPATAPAAEAAKPVPATAAPATEGQPQAEAARAPAEGEEAPKPAEEAAPSIDKDKLAKCYQAVYCAQKKNEMDKILGIYKEFGFDTPQAFTKTWIEAAKDTDWVTKIAHEVGKKCP